MSVDWANKAANNMLGLSRSKVLAAAMKEWTTTGGYDDTQGANEVCELCEHEGLRYQFEIENVLTKKSLWIGSTCITRFVSLFENGIEILGEENKLNLLNRRRSQYEAISRQDRAFEVLDKLAEKEREIFGAAKWKLKWKLGYSAHELKMVSALCKKHQVVFNSESFKINTRRGSIVEQVRQLERWQYLRLRAALPASRQAQFNDFFKVKKRQFPG
ncbi:MAG TPA: hypothetical protein VIZ65_10725 [Cellvibrionaceae bacterium]